MIKKIKISIIAFAFLLMLGFLISTLGGFIVFHADKRGQTAEIIVYGLRNSINEMSFLITNYIDQHHAIKQKTLFNIMPFLEKKVELDPLVTGISLFTLDKKLLVSTDENKFNVYPNESVKFDNYVGKKHYAFLIDSPSLKTKVSYFDDVKQHIVLVYYLDVDIINSLFERDKNRYIIMFIVFPLVMMMLAFIVVYKTLLKPMRDLEWYSYKQEKKPSQFFITELDRLRNSVVETIERLESEKTKLYNLNRTDALSGIPNRLMLEEFLEKKIKMSIRSKETFAFIFMDLDNFKRINDTLGHDVGDEIIKEVAQRLQNSIRAGDIVSRIGGDEFVLIVSGYSHKMGLVRTIERIRDNIKNVPFNVADKVLNITSSIGVAIYPEDGTTSLELVKHADIALYEAKNKGKNDYMFFTAHLNEEIQTFMELVDDMKVALLSNQFELYYQPQNDVYSDKIIGVEALIRWKHPTKGFISPNKFIPIAEQTGFILELGSWVLEKAISQKKQWENIGLDFKTSINVSANQILTNDFVDELKRLLDFYQVHRKNVCIEITEYVFIDSTEDILKKFNSIKELGVTLCLDDFGTGYSALSFLKKIPIDIVKIDKAFIDDISTHDGKIFLETIVKMCATFGLGVVAEGVETQEQHDFLKKIECDIFQGFLCSKPLPMPRFEHYYKDCCKKEICTVCEHECRIHNDVKMDID